MVWYSSVDSRVMDLTRLLCLKKLMRFDVIRASDISRSGTTSFYLFNRGPCFCVDREAGCIW
jgi:hypothetical protein